MNSIRTIFFDFGNVIAFFDHERTTRRLQPHTHLPYEQLYKAVYPPKLFNEFEAGRLATADYVRRAFAEAALTCDEACFRLVFADIFEPNHGVCELIPRLAASHRLVLASNTNELHAERFLKTYRSTFGHFQKLVLSHEVGARKPEADFYAHCQQFAGCEPARCLFIDDRADNIAAARRHGWQTVQYTDFDVLLRELARLGVYNNGFAK